MDTIILIAGLVALGACSGFLGGLLGIGGGVVIVPALIIFFESTGTYAPGTATVVAVATSLACITFTSASAAWTQYRAGMVLWPTFRQLVLTLIAGSIIAGFATPWLPALLFRLIIALFLVFVAGVMLANWKPAQHRQLPGAMGSAAIGLGGGLIAGTAGIAGGNVIVPTLVYFNTPIHRATATSSALGVPIAAAGALSYLVSGLVSPGAAGGAAQAGFIDVPSFLAITLAAVVFAPVGVKLAHRVPAARLKRIFGGLLLIVSLRMLYSLQSLV